MKIKIRNTQPKVGWVCLGWLDGSMVRWSGGEVSRSQWAVQGVPWLGSPLLPREAPTGESLGRIACRYLVMSKWSYENVSFVFQVQMSSTDTKQRGDSPFYTPPHNPLAHGQWSAFCIASFSLSFDFYLFCSLAIFMPLLCLLFAIAAAFWPQMLLRL